MLAWYEQNGAEVPWRPGPGRPGDPYAALVAAVCAQQTPMSRALPLYRRWMEALPTLAAAASSSRAEVLALWGDGGYPRRAVALREAAQAAVAGGGELPRDEKALLALPGVGPFTAAIVRCFGYGEQVAAVDVNVMRVLSRSVWGELEPVRSVPRAEVERLAARMLPPGDAARWNPALMDLGAATCRSRPLCGKCPLERLCRARRRIARGEEAPPPRRQPRYEGSDRQWRGHILRILRAAAGAGGTGSVAEESLMGGLAESPGERARAAGLLAALVREGLAWRSGGRCGLGEGPDVAAGEEDTEQEPPGVLPSVAADRAEGSAMAEVYSDDRFTVEAHPDLGPFANVSYIIRPADGGPATVIDVPEGFEEVLAALGGREFGALIVTHYHRDHWDGFDVFRAVSSAPVYAGAEEIEIDESRGVRRLADGSALEVGGVRIEVMHTPGHTPGSICLRAGGVVFTGDTLFPGGPGASRSAEALQQEIRSITERLYTLPGEMLVLPGHGAGTTIAASREEYAGFASREHAADLHGNVLWASS